MTGVLAPEAGADALAQMVGHLTAPLGAGAARSSFSPDGTGKVSLPPARRPTLLAVLRQALQQDELVVSASIAGQPALDGLRFAPFSPAGSALMLWTGGEVLAAADCTLAAKLGAAALAPTDLADWLGLDLVEGNLGRLLAALGDEKARLRRETAQLAAMRALAFAAGDALDRIGADVGVPRLSSKPAWNGASEEIIAIPAPETDADYRRRLAVWRPLVVPTPAGVRSLLGQVDPRVTVREAATQMAVAVRIIGAGDDSVDPARTYLLGRLRTDRLAYLNDNGTGAAIHAARPMTDAGRSAEAAMRARLASAFSAAPDAALAPRLAQGLDRAARVLIALGAAPVPIAHAQDPAGGSRYETGMGVAVTLPALAAADTLRTAMLAAAGGAALADPLADQLVRQAAALAPPPGERALDWLWEVAGLATRHQLDADTLYLSHLSTAGLTIETQRAGRVVTLRAVFNAPGDPGHSAALQQALDRIAAAPSADFTAVPAANVASALALAQDLAPAHPANNVLAGAGLPPGTNGASAATALGSIPADLWTLYELESSLAAKVRAGDPAANAPLAAIVQAMRAAGFVSLLPLVGSIRVFLVAGVVSLPSAGVNLGERIATGVRWMMIPLTGSAELAQPTGFASKVMLAPDSLVAMVALAYIRDGNPEPYELQIDLPDGQLLDPAGYERVMNALERVYALGVQVNTWRLRQGHVDLDGDGAGDPLPPRLARHYRQFRMPRMRGIEEPETDDSEFPTLTSG